jgi:transcriptional accessory protein Tex/SPT6
VRDASEVVKVGQKVQVTVMEVDLKRNRIALSHEIQAGPRRGMSDIILGIDLGNHELRGGRRWTPDFRFC